MTEDKDLAMQSPALAIEDIDRRIRFDDLRETMEVDFSDLSLDSSAEVNALYDRLEERIDATGEDLWFFLINYANCRIAPEAWFAYSRRGKTLNHAHSMGSVRYDATEETRAQIERSAGTEAFDANLFADRGSALARIAEMPTRRLKTIVHAPNHTAEEIATRVRFLDAEEIMEIDLSRFLLAHSRDVDDLYDHLETRIQATGRRWYFLINYNDTRIEPAAWVQFAQRGKRLNLGGSLGSVRYEAGVEVEADIRLRAQSQGFRPNVLPSREAALERIAELKAEAASTNA